MTSQNSASTDRYEALNIIIDADETTFSLSNAPPITEKQQEVILEQRRHSQTSSLSSGGRSRGRGRAQTSHRACATSATAAMQDDSDPGNDDIDSNATSESTVPFRESLNSTEICASLPPSATDTNAFRVHRLLNPAECSYLIAQAEPHLKPMDTQYVQKHRKAARVMFRAPAMARELFMRLRPFLVEEDYKDRTPLCFGHDGVWVPFGLNECLKIFKYNPGGSFVEHRDGPWVPREDQCSMYTLVLYLNNAFTGGQTSLIGTGGKRNQNPLGSRRRRFGYENGNGKLITPMTGCALVFNHDCWHAAEPVAEGAKWILRTEIIFQRIHSFYVDKLAFASDEGYLAAKSLYHESMKAMEEGRREDFFEMYAKVVGLQRDAMVTVERSKQPQLLSRLNHDTFSQVLAFLRTSDIKKSLLTINRRTFAAVVTSAHWQVKWASLVTANATVKETRRLETAKAFEHYKSLKPQRSGVASEAGMPLSCGDYFTLYRQQLHMQKRCVPAALILSDPIATFVYRTETPLDYGKFEDATRVRFHKSQQFGSYMAAVTHPWYGDWKYAYPLHMNAPSSERLTTGSETGEGDFLRKGRMIDPFTGQPQWSVLSVPIDTVVDPRQVPLLIIPHPAWTEENEEAFALNALEAAFGVMRVPAVAMCHPAVCLMVASYNITADAEEFPADATTAVVIVSEQGVHTFVVSIQTFAILRQSHYVATKRLGPKPRHQYGADEEPAILPAAESEILCAVHHHLQQAFESERVLISVTDATLKTKITEMANEHLSKRHGTSSTAKSVSTNTSLVRGAIKLLQCPSFRSKCLYRY